MLDLFDMMFRVYTLPAIPEPEPEPDQDTFDDLLVFYGLTPPEEEVETE